MVLVVVSEVIVRLLLVRRSEPGRVNGWERADRGLRGRANHGLELAEGDGVEADLLGRRFVNICLAGEEGGQLGQYHDGRGGWGRQEARSRVGRVVGGGV